MVSYSNLVKKTELNSVTNKRRQYWRFVLSILWVIPWVWGLFSAIANIDWEIQQWKINDIHRLGLEEYKSKIKKDKKGELQHVGNFCRTLVSHLSRGYWDVVMMTNERGSFENFTFIETEIDFNPAMLLNFLEVSEYTYDHKQGGYSLAIYDFLNVDREIVKRIGDVLTSTSWKYNDEFYHFLNEYKKSEDYFINQDFDEGVCELNDLRHSSSLERWDIELYHQLDYYKEILKEGYDLSENNNRLVCAFYERINNFLKLKKYAENYLAEEIYMKPLD